jgi:hypothetical protein
MSNSFPFSVGNSLLTSGNTIIFTDEAVRAFANKKSIPVNPAVAWSPAGASTLLRNMGTKVYAFGSNRLKTHEFRRVQLVSGSGTEGVGSFETGYVCVWAASGSAPATLS